MKLETASVLEQDIWLKPGEIHLPRGLIGFPEAQRLELIYNPEELPFMWLRSTDNRSLNFIVIEPFGLVPRYVVEISDEDSAQLAIKRPEEALLLNIVNFRPDEPGSATVNLIGPIAINRRTLVGRQIVIANYADYSARHPLVAPEAAAAAGA